MIIYQSDKKLLLNDVFTRDIERVIFTKGTVSYGNFAGISSAFRCSAVTNATGVPRAVLVRSVT